MGRDQLEALYGGRKPGINNRVWLLATGCWLLNLLKGEGVHGTDHGPTRLWTFAYTDLETQNGLLMLWMRPES